MRFQTSLAALLVAFAFIPTMPALAHDNTTPAGHHAEHAAAQVGNITITGAFSRATLPNAPVGGGFLTLTNAGSVDDVLVSASAPIAAETQLHEMAMEGDVMKMRQLKEGIPVPAGQTVTLAPGGLHIMFMGLNGPIVEGQSIPVTLTFQQAGTVTLDMAVGATAADAPAHDMSGHAGHDATTSAHHGSGTDVDQAGMSDLDAIAIMQKAMFDTPDNPLAMGPIVIAGDYAVSDWAQNGMGGRALLRKTAAGWGIHLCSGAALKDAAALVLIGVPQAVADQLADQLAAAEAALTAEQIALYDSFHGTMIVDEELI